MAQTQHHHAVGLSARPTRTTPRPAKTAVILARQIVDQILRDELLPGSLLPPESEMLEAYGVGRGTLREALRYLELQGVLAIKQGPRGGPVVMSPDGYNLASVLSMLLALKRTPFRQIIEVRLLLEPPICGLAAKEASEADLELVRDITTAMADPKLDDDSFLHLNQKFHEAVAQAAHNDVLAFFVTSLHSISDGAVVGISYSRGRRKAVVRAHEEIVTALEARDAVGPKP